MNKFQATRDASGFDPFPYRVIEEVAHGSKLLCRCESAQDAERIVKALAGNPIQASLLTRDGETLRKIDEALKLLNSTKPTAPKADKIRVVL